MHWPTFVRSGYTQRLLATSAGTFQKAVNKENPTGARAEWCRCRQEVFKLINKSKGTGQWRHVAGLYKLRIWLCGQYWFWFCTRGSFYVNKNSTAEFFVHQKLGKLTFDTTLALRRVTVGHSWDRPGHRLHSVLQTLLQWDHTNRRLNLSHDFCTSVFYLMWADWLDLD